MVESILLAVDEDAVERDVVAHTRALAEHLSASVYVLHVVDVTELETAPESEVAREDAAEFVADVASTFEEAGVPVETAVRTAKPWEAIVACATDVDADLVVMGTHGRTGIEHFELGSVAEAVVRDSTVPVLTVPVHENATVSFPYERVLVATDGSPEALAAARVAVSLAARCDADVHVLSVVETAALGLDVRSEILEAEQRGPAADAVTDVHALASEAGVDVTTTVTAGVPRAEIEAYVTSNDVDMVAMGTHGRSGVAKYLLGNVAERTLRTSTVPVLTAGDVDGTGVDGG
ncbi:universal stress protein [Halorubellus litoreus]|uniref:Universal stress protein n=1 Tax=Halorubellus litoreus TaxID=755308 RepID=A0ABD5VHI3_9EURY